MQYIYIAVYNVVLIDKVSNNNNNIIIGELYQLSFSKSFFSHNNNNFNNFYLHKMYLMHVITLCVQKLETKILYKYSLDHMFTIRKVTKNIEKYFNYGIFTFQKVCLTCYPQWLCHNTHQLHGWCPH